MLQARRGIPLSLDKDEYVLLEEAEKEQPIDNYSYQCGVMDCFCEMVASGLKKAGNEPSM